MYYESNIVDNGCLLILALFVVLLYTLTESRMFKKEKFTTYNKTISPALISNPETTFKKQSKFKHKTYASNTNFQKGCGEDCKELKQAIKDIHTVHPLIPDIRNEDVDWLLEPFDSKKESMRYNDSYSENCTRPQMLDMKLNDAMLGRTWNFDEENRKSCDQFRFTQDDWSFIEKQENPESFNNRRSTDSLILPYRSLPENTVIEKFQNQNSILFNTDKCSDRKKNIGFDSTSSCCFRNSEHAETFQTLNENKLGDSMKLLDYAFGDINLSSIYGTKYNKIIEAPSMSNQVCP